MGTTENTESTELSEMSGAEMRNIDQIASSLFLSVPSVSPWFNNLISRRLAVNRMNID